MALILRLLVGVGVSFGFVVTAHAYVPLIVAQETLHDLTTITDPDLSQVFFGQLTGLPHTYEIFADKPFTLSVQIRIPDTEDGKNNVSGIIIKEQRKGRVEEITRFLAQDASWEIKDDPLTGDEYREGASFEKELSAGMYRLEVHTPDNVEKYMLEVGTRDDMTLGYFELLGRLLQVKDFYGTHRFGIVLSPYVYWPLVVFGTCVFVLWYVWRKGIFSPREGSSTT